MDCLTAIELVVPAVEARLADAVFDLLAPFGTRQDATIALTPSRPEYLPLVTLRFTPAATPRARFLLDDRGLEVALVNATGTVRRSPYRYTAIAPTQLRDRLRAVTCTTLDHVGFDLPWFDGLHPAMAMLRDVLAPHCAYFTFPTGEPWDFILPAARDELGAGVELDLDTTRRPKFEVVSLDTASTPIIQLDFVVDRPYQQLVALFPEGLASPAARSVWVYLAGWPDLDVCCVFNEPGTADWCPFFAGHRLRLGT